MVNEIHLFHKNKRIWLQIPLMKLTRVKSTLLLKSWDVMIKEKKKLEKGSTRLSCYDRKMWTCIQHLVEKLLGISKLFQNVKYFILYAEHVELSSFSDDWKDIYAENNSRALDWGEVSRSLGKQLKVWHMKTLHLHRRPHMKQQSAQEHPSCLS